MSDQNKDQGSAAVRGEAVADVVGRAALNEFIEKVCLGKSELISCAEAAFYWFNKSAAAPVATTEPTESHPAWSRMILYTDTIKGKQTCRDDLWAITTTELKALLSPRAADAPSEPMSVRDSVISLIERAQKITPSLATCTYELTSIQIAWIIGQSRLADALDSRKAAACADPEEPTEREALIACLSDDAVTLLRANPDDEMAQTMREAAAMLESDEVVIATLDMAIQPTVAAQQGSIADDAQFRTLISAYSANTTKENFGAIVRFLNNRASAAPAASVVGWKVECSDDDDGSTWLTLTTPHGGSAMYRCKTAHDNGPTISSQIAHAFAADFSQQEGSEAGNG